ncbi:unknown [Mycoplasma sp. CAG:472]|nr:unknown [Mycoplasma sp. CAG:472]
MNRELENQIKRANNMLEYYNEKLIKDETKLKSAKSSKIFSLIETIILFIINSMFFILVTYALATGNILPSLISISIYAGTLDRLVKTSKEYKKLNEDYLNIRNTVIQDSSYIKTYEEELTKAISKLNELENEPKKDNNYTLNNSEDLSKPLVRKRVLK